MASLSHHKQKDRELVSGFLGRERRATWVSWWVTTFEAVHAEGWPAPPAAASSLQVAALTFMIQI